MALLGVAAAVSGFGCGSDTAGPEYWDSTDSAYKVLENLELAYNRMDLERYAACLREDFEFIALDDEWGGPEVDLDPWGLETELHMHQAMFESGAVDYIDLELEVSQGVPYGGGRLFQCEFSLSIQTDSLIVCQGQAHFMCTQDSTEEGAWRVWQWYDSSDMAGDSLATWAEAKHAFLWERAELEDEEQKGREEVPPAHSLTRRLRTRAW